MPRKTSLGYSIEQLQQKKTEWEETKERYQTKNEYCGTHRLANIDKKTVIPTNCGMFSCSSCREGKIIHTVKNIRKLAFANDLTRFLTMTVGGNDVRSQMPIKESFYFLEEKFRIFKILYKRKFGHDLQYVKLARSHKDGYCHYHILIDQYIPKIWLNQAMKRINSGYCNIKYVDPQRVSAYLSAYLETKEHEWFIPKGIKHYSMSKGLSFEKFIPKDEWIFINIYPEISKFLPQEIQEKNRIFAIYQWLLWNGGHGLFGKPPPKNLFDIEYPSINEVKIIKKVINCNNRYILENE
jgi:hypothetical protein